jgi:hypothetical protein
MFFYLLQHSTLIEKELDKNTKVTKIFLYGGISYIILHATLFIGGKDALLYSLKSYFWLFFMLDISTIFLTNNKDIDLNNIINNLYSSKSKKKKKPYKSVLKINSHNDSNKLNNYDFEKKVEKKVSFVEESEYTSDSDSDIGTDIDFDDFKHSLNL